MANGITSTGFIRKRLDEILSDKNDAVREVFGPDINLTPQSPDGQINGVLAESDANLWELAQAAYDAFNPDAAVGNILSNLVQLNGITRQASSPSLASLSLIGVNGTLVPAGSIVETSSGVQYSTDTAVTIAGGVATVQASAVIYGSTATLMNQITRIVTPVAGWSTVNNPADVTVGLDEETDAELRIRRQNSVAFPSQSLVESIYSGVANISGVSEVIVYENDTNAVDGNGQAPHSIQAVVVGGDNTEIAEEIFKEKATGISTVGSTVVQVTDIMGVSHDIRFQRPIGVDIYVIVNLTTNASYPADGDDQVTQAIIDFANGELTSISASSGFGVGDDVIYSLLYSPVNTIPGLTVDSLFIDITPAPAATANIPIAFNEISVFDSANIVVNS